MSISRKIGNTHLEEMSLILDFIINFDVKSLLYAINGKNLNESEIESITLDIIEQNNKLCRQKKHLFEFSKVFNKEFATDDNNFFDSSAKVSRKMRSGTKGVRDILKKFCKVNRRPVPTGQEAPQAINVSMITTPNYIADLFGLSSYPECVKKLFATMLEFYGNLEDCIKEAMRTLQEEKDTRKDKQKMLSLLKDAFEKSRKNQNHIIEAMEAEPDLKRAILQSENLTSNEKNQVLKHWKISDNEEIFAAEFFHNCTPNDINKITLYNAYSQQTDDPVVNRFMVLLGIDEKKARNILEAINNFDHLLPDKCKRNQIPAMYLYAFMKWFGVFFNYSTFLTLFNEQYKTAGGRWDTITKSALNGVSSKTIRNADQYDMIKNEVEEKLNKMFSLK